MVRCILKFAELLRKAGIRITPVEIQDCMKAVELTGMEKSDFKYTLRSTLIKDIRELQVFDKLFELYFCAFVKETWKVSNEITLQQRKTVGQEAKGLGKSGAGGPGQDILSVLASGNEELLDKTAQDVVEALGCLEPRDIENIREKVQEAKVKLEWYMALHEMDKKMQEEKINFSTYQEWHSRLRDLERKIEKELHSFFINNYGDKALQKIAEAQNINQNDFLQLNAAEIEQVKEKLARLGKQLSFKKSRRYRPAPRGRIDIKKVSKKALACGGVPLEMVYKRKRPERPELVILCDVSNSVSRYSFFMLQTVYAAESFFKDIHTFAFVDHLSCISHLFRRMSPEKAVLEIKSLSEVSDSGCSHFGQVFFEFYTNYFYLINDKSTVIILGDAKNNWRSSGVDYFKKMVQRSKRLYWLNPQPFKEWDKDDSIMSTYAWYCTGVYECRNLQQLEQLVNAIF
ncbi:MAG: VWA domain-containing protein [Clostridiales bacterium]|nr:VWA domain-containing protein [Clostridiales bacterium]MCF8021888.1 VWA domain-containing protein [Clostridiales bacterium]